MCKLRYGGLQIRQARFGSKTHEHEDGFDVIGQLFVENVLPAKVFEGYV